MFHESERKIMNNVMRLGRLDIDTLRTEYLEYIDVSEQTVKTYDIGIQKFIKFIRQKGVEAPTRNDVVEFKNYLIDNDYKPATTNSYLIAIRNFFKFLSYKGVYLNITENIKSVPDSETHKRDALTVEQCHKVLGVLKNLREKVLFYITLSCGLRANEIVNIRLNDFVLEQGKYRLYVLGKGRKTKIDYVIVPNNVIELIKEYVKEYNITDYLFVSMARKNRGEKLSTRALEMIMNDIFTRAGIKTDKITFHSLRHTFGTIAITNGEDLREVSKAMRHKSVVTTERYLHDLDMQNNNCSNKVLECVLNGMVY